MKTLELNQMERLNGGTSNPDCQEDVGLSFLFGLMVAGPLGALAGAYTAMQFSENCN